MGWSNGASEVVFLSLSKKLVRSEPEIIHLYGSPTDGFATDEKVSLKKYFKDVTNPSQQEVDMFNMLFGTQFTKEDLQFDN